LTIAGATLGLVSAAACSRKPESGGAGPAPRGGVAGTPPSTQLVSDVSHAEWRMAAGDYGNLRFSTLDAVTTANVLNLHVVTTLSTGVPRGHEGQPLVVNNTMYVVTPFPNNLLAIDLTKTGGAPKWVYQPHPDPRSVGIACCDVVNRGAHYADGKMVYSLLDTTVVAVDEKDGHEVWLTTVGNTDLGETFAAAPLIAKDKVIVGNSGGELGVRGYVVALSLSDGKTA
jgi:alcohol dehydrogenase (cytochrome c)